MGSFASVTAILLALVACLSNGRNAAWAVPTAAAETQQWRVGQGVDGGPVASWSPAVTESVRLAERRLAAWFATRGSGGKLFEAFPGERTKADAIWNLRAEVLHRAIRAGLFTVEVR